MAGAQLLKRVPLIKFPPRHSRPDSSGSDEALKAFISRGQSGPSTLSANGKASEQPKRAPLSKDEIEAILLGGCV